jgi:AraC-like DNA-binding protein
VPDIWYNLDIMKTSHKKAIAGSYMIPVLEYIDCHQLLDSKALLAELNIKRSQLDSNRFFLSCEQYVAFMTPLLEKCDMHDLIYYLVSNQNISQHGLIGLLALCSLNVRQIVGMVGRFYKLRSRLVEIDFHEEDDAAVIRVTPAYDLGPAKEFTVEMGLAALHSAKQQVLNRDDNHLDKIYITHEKRIEEHFLGDHVIYNQPYNQLVFPREELELKLKSTHKPTFEMLEAQCNDLLDDDRADITTKVRRIIKESDENFPTLTTAAARLATSSRTLSRKLKLCGKTYQQILDEERVARAKQLLLDTDLNVTEIAMYLNFTDSSHMTKLFKQYVNKTPLKYRQSQQILN